MSDCGCRTYKACPTHAQPPVVTSAGTPLPTPAPPAAERVSAERPDYADYMEWRERDLLPLLKKAGQSEAVTLFSEQIAHEAWTAALSRRTAPSQGEGIEELARLASTQPPSGVSWYSAGTPTAAPSPEGEDGKWRKKPVVVEAHRWLKNGDHPGDGEAGWEGRVVRYYRNPDDNGARVCEHCGTTMHNHGWIDTLEGGHVVCPGDWIITGVKGERYPCKPDIFAETHEPASTPPPASPDVERVAVHALLDRLIDMGPEPEAPGHFCGPEAQCDGICAEFHYYIENRRRTEREMIDQARALAGKGEGR